MRINNIQSSTNFKAFVVKPQGNVFLNETFQAESLKTLDKAAEVMKNFKYVDLEAGIEGFALKFKNLSTPKYPMGESIKSYFTAPLKFNKYNQEFPLEAEPTSIPLKFKLPSEAGKLYNILVNSFMVDRAVAVTSHLEKQIAREENDMQAQDPRKFAILEELVKKCSENC